MAAQIYDQCAKEPAEKSLAEHMEDAVSYMSLLIFLGDMPEKQGEDSDAANVYGQGSSGSPTESVTSETSYLTRRAPATFVKGGLAKGGLYRRAD